MGPYVSQTFVRQQDVLPASFHARCRDGEHRARQTAAVRGFHEDLATS